MIKRVVIMLPTILLIIALLSGCTAKKAKTEAQICSDILSSKLFSDHCPGMVIDSCEISKRRTDHENRSDIVFADTSFSNETKTVLGSASWILQYGLYNDGWELESIEVDYDNDFYFYPTDSLEKDPYDVYADLYELQGCTSEDFTIYETAFDEMDYYCTTTYYFTATLYYRFAVKKVDAAIVYPFDSYIGEWGTPFYMPISEECSWRLKNTYFYKDADGTEKKIKLDESFDGIFPKSTSEGSRIDPLFEIDSWPDGYTCFDGRDFDIERLFMSYPNSSGMTNALSKGYHLLLSGDPCDYTYVVVDKSNWPDTILISENEICIFEHGSEIIDTYRKIVEIPLISLFPRVGYTLPNPP